MKIIKDNQGWRIEPSTSDEEEHLRYLFEALEIAYGDPSVVTIDGLDFHIKSIPIPEYPTKSVGD